jgi:hypothetical protein
MSTALDTHSRSFVVADALAGLGWSHHSGAPLEFSRLTAAGLLALRGYLTAAGWLQLFATGDGVPAVSRAGVFRANAALAGPAKYVVRSRLVSLRFDLPLEVVSASEAAGSGRGPTTLDRWAADLTAVLAPSEVDPPSCDPAPAAELAAALEAQGWVAAVDGERQVRLTVAVPGLFRHVLIRSDSAGTHIWTELASLAGWSKRSQQAALVLAHAANDRLRLARFALAADGATLVAEVALGSAAMPGVWLDAALDALHGAIVGCGRELAALRDERLARLVLEQRVADVPRPFFKGAQV